jgi:thymidylate synthase
MLHKWLAFMHAKYQMEAEHVYLDLLSRLLVAPQVDDRTGIGCRSLFGEQLRFPDVHAHFPLLTTKRVFWRGVIEELAWFLRGDTDARHLSEDKGVHIWDGNTSREFLDEAGLTEFREGDAGAIYGFQWRHFGAPYMGCDADYEGKGIDQIKEALRMIREEPESRRILVTAWDPTSLPDAALPPCHVMFQFNVRPRDLRLDCHVLMRSTDVFLGLPFNIASYAMLLHMMAAVSDLVPGDLIISMGNVHLYNNHIAQAREQLTRAPRMPPCLVLRRTADAMPSDPSEFDVHTDFELQGYDPHPPIKAIMAV